MRDPYRCEFQRCPDGVWRDRIGANRHAADLVQLELEIQQDAAGVLIQAPLDGDTPVWKCRQYKPGA